jgi:regulatory protein YycI of two-component signal transduction system YycFG
VGPGDTITVSLGENDEVIYFFKTWRELEQVGEMSIIDVDTAIKNLQEGKTTRKPAGIDYPMVEISEMEVGYFSDASDNEQEFYKPVWIFRGTDDHGNNVTKYVNGVAK